MIAHPEAIREELSPGEGLTCHVCGNIAVARYRHRREDGQTKVLRYCSACEQLLAAPVQVEP